MSDLDFERLLEPIPGSRSSGADLRYDPVYDKIRAAREEDDPSLPRGVWERDLKRADWVQVERLCTEVLADRSKDLQVAFWLLEALIERGSFKGLADGSMLIRRLTMEFWDELHPRAEQGSLERRLSLFLWLDQKVTFRFRALPLTNPADPDTPSYNYLDWQRALRSMREQRPSDDEDAMTMARFDKSTAVTPTPFYQATYEHLKTALAEWKQIDDFIYEKLGNDKPALNDLFQVLSEMEHKVKNVLAGRGPVAPAASSDAPNETQQRETEDPTMASNNGPGQQAGFSGPINSRSDAYRQLNEIAEYLMRIEPHSPTPYLLKRVAAWETLSLADLLKETVTGIDDRARVRESLFMKPENE